VANHNYLGYITCLKYQGPLCQSENAKVHLKGTFIAHSLSNRRAFVCLELFVPIIPSPPDAQLHVTQTFPGKASITSFSNFGSH
jgi:hypothetical protein